MLSAAHGAWGLGGWAAGRDGRSGSCCMVHGVRGGAAGSGARGLRRCHHVIAGVADHVQADLRRSQPRAANMLAKLLPKKTWVKPNQSDVDYRVRHCKTQPPHQRISTAAVLSTIHHKHLYTRFRLRAWVCCVRVSMGLLSVRRGCCWTHT